MGCSFSRQSRRDADSNPRVFKVFNVDDQGQELNAGKIEITELDLILHQKSKEPIRWPLCSLRRYGFDAELFSFESGRRCPTGPGIYAFRCRRAEALFNLLQECIQRAGQEDQNQQRPAAIDVTTSASQRGSLVEIHTPSGSLPANVTLVGSGAGVGVNSSHHYINGYVATASNASTPASSMPCPCPSAHGLPLSMSTSASSMAVASGGGGPSTQAMSASGSSSMASGKMHEYVNTEIAVGAVGATSMPGSHQSLDASAIQLKLQRPSDAHVVNYAELDLPKSVEELNYGSGAAGGQVSIVELDPSSSQATYFNVPAEPESDLLLRRSLMTSSSAATAINGVPGSGGGGVTGTGSAGTVRKILMRQLSKEDPHNYANLDILSSAAARGGGGGGVAEARGRKVTYIQVDVRSSRENLYAGGNPPASPISLSPSIPDSPRRTESYAQIDFHKTHALSKCVKTEDEGSRKTRHNSNIDELN